MERRDPRHPDEQATVAEGTAAVKSPSDPDSSPPSDSYSSGSSPTVVGPGSDAPTVVHVGSDAPTVIHAGPDAPTALYGASPPTVAGSRAPSGAWSGGDQPILHPGTILGRRYEIQQLLGQGGMGAVYRARDREVNRMVALKVIRPEMAGNPAILERFKQELVLSHQVTHRNVVRIYDLGDADGLKFMTMEFIEGQDLRTLITQKGTFPPDEAVEIMRQVCWALEAAHAVGVIHRDLKPQNIMRDTSGRVVVMDFGLARALDSTDGMTQTGAIVGTMEYMSPEQGLGKPLDERSDLFTVGLIFYELLTGRMPYKADSALASLLKRTQERAAPVSSHNANIPRALSDIVARSMEPKVQDRYQHVGEILTALEAWEGKDAAATLRFSGVHVWGRDKNWPLVGGIAAVLVLALIGFLLRAKIVSHGPSAPTSPTLSLAILPFRNASGDPSLDWLGSYLAETLSTDVGQSAVVQTVSSDRIHQLWHDLRLTPNSSLDATTLQRLGASSDAQAVVWGQYVKLGNQIHIEASLQDFKRDRTAPLKADAPNESALPATVDRLAQAIRDNLSVSASVVKELQAQAFKPSSKSLPALRDYNEGVELARRRNDLEARKRFESATQEDPEFALAYARLSEVLSVLGYENEAEQASSKAVELSQNLSAPEKYRIASSHLRILRDYPKAIEAYENLAKASPNDTDVQSALGDLYFRSRAFDKARSLYGRLLERDPKSADALFGLGRVEVTSGNPQNGLDYLNRVLTITIQLENDEEKALVLHVMGVAYRKLNKPDEAMRNFQASLAITRGLGEKAAIARSLNEMGQLLYGVGKSDEALKNYQESLKLRRDLGDKRGIGDTLIDLGNIYQERGQYDSAMQGYKESLQIQRDLGDEFSQAICLNNMGNVYSARGDYQEALTFYQQALQLREKLKVPVDIAETVHNLGDTAMRMGQFDQALAHYLRALDLYRSADDKRDAAIESHSTAEIFNYQGRYGAALKAEDEALTVFRQLQDRGMWLGDILSGYGNALTLLGRGDEAQKSFAEAQEIARDIKSDPMTAQVLNFQGDRFFYAGDMKSAKPKYEEALRSASRAKDRDKVLVSKLNLAKVAVAEGSSREAIKALKELASQADVLGLKYFSLECSVYLAQALINTKDYSAAEQELHDTLDRSEKLGSQMLRAKSHFLLATALRLSGNAPEAAGHYREAVRLLDEIRKEPGADKVVERADLKAIYQESTRWSQT